MSPILHPVRRLMPVVVVLALALAASPTSAATVAIGDQKYSMFGDARFRWLDVDHARLVVSWNVLARDDWERPWIARWLRDARRAGVRPLVSFGHEWTGPGRRHLPSVREYRRELRRFRARYPWVRELSPWNEANHCSQPTCHRPERAAAYFDVVREECPSCTVVAADVLDQRGMGPWLARFRRAARHRPTIWGLHNYLDANRLRSTGTRRLLAAVKGEVWLTETGGVVRRTRYKGQAAFPETPEHAAAATRWILRVAESQPRVRRVYLYQWNADSLTQRWDSGLIDPFGQRRPAFDVVARAHGRDPATAPGDPYFPGVSPPPGPGTPPPGPGTPPSPPPPSEPPPPGPKPPPCFLVLVCPKG